jgi:hypothetical protein
MQQKIKKVHGFERSVRCDRTKQLRIFPIVPKMSINIVKVRLSCVDILLIVRIKFSSDDNDIFLLNKKKSYMSQSFIYNSGIAIAPKSTNLFFHEIIKE